MEYRSLPELLLWAEWAAYNRFYDVLKNVVATLEKRGIQIDEDTVLQKRLTFLGYDRLNMIGEDFDLEESLSTLEHLRENHQDCCQTPDTSPLQWLRIRQATLVQMCIAKLYQYLGMTIGDHPSDDPREIKVPAAYKMKEYEKHVSELLNSYKMHDPETMMGKIEDESHRYSRSVLVENFNFVSTGSIGKEKMRMGIHYLLHQFPFAEYASTVTAFSRKVESQALPPPVLSSRTAEMCSAMCPPGRDEAPTQNMVEEEQAIVDWSEVTRDSQGPYASPPAVPTKIKISSSSKKSNIPRGKSTPKKSPGKSNRAEESEEDTDEQSCEDEPVQPLGKRTRSSGKISNDKVDQAKNNLRQVGDSFRATNREKDPLYNCLDESGANDTGRGSRKRSKKEEPTIRVKSVVGRSSRRLRSGKQEDQYTGPEEDIDEFSSEREEGERNEEEEQKEEEKESDSKRGGRHQKTTKKSMTSARPTSTTVTFNSEEEEEDLVITSTIPSKREQLERAKEEFVKFPSTLQASSSERADSKEVGHTNQNRTRWTSDEEDALMEGVQRHGASCWALIRDDPLLKHRFNNRSNTNMKDKFRNLKKKGIVDN